MVHAGIIYAFFMYGGKHSAGADKCAAENLVLRLVQNIPKHQNYQEFFDNWFSTFPLLLKLQSEYFSYSNIQNESPGRMSPNERQRFEKRRSREF